MKERIEFVVQERPDYGMGFTPKWSDISSWRSLKAAQKEVDDYCGIPPKKRIVERITKERVVK